VKKPEQLQDNLKSVDIKLTAEELAKLDEVSKLAPEYPGWMLERQGGDRKA
jgi:aryl-alcohol dehydrogenase-like predicted oxidoreductase